VELLLWAGAEFATQWSMSSELMVVVGANPLFWLPPWLKSIRESDFFKNVVALSSFRNPTSSILGATFRCGGFPLWRCSLSFRYYASPFAMLFFSTRVFLALSRKCWPRLDKWLSEALVEEG